MGIRKEWKTKKKGRKAEGTERKKMNGFEVDGEKSKGEGKKGKKMDGREGKGMKE